MILYSRIYSTSALTIIFQVNLGYLPQFSTSTWGQVAQIFLWHDALCANQLTSIKALMEGLLLQAE